MMNITEFDYKTHFTKKTGRYPVFFIVNHKK